MKAQCRMSKVMKVRHQKSRTKSRTPFTSQSRGNSSTFLTLAQSRQLAQFLCQRSPCIISRQLAQFLCQRSPCIISRQIAQFLCQRSPCIISRQIAQFLCQRSPCIILSLAQSRQLAVLMLAQLMGIYISLAQSRQLAHCPVLILAQASYCSLLQFLVQLQLSAVQVNCSVFILAQPRQQHFFLGRSPGSFLVIILAQFRQLDQVPILAQSRQLLSFFQEQSSQRHHSSSGAVRSQGSFSILNLALSGQLNLVFLFQRSPCNCFFLSLVPPGSLFRFLFQCIPCRSVLSLTKRRSRQPVCAYAGVDPRQLAPDFNLAQSRQLLHYFFDAPRQLAMLTFLFYCIRGSLLRVYTVFSSFSVKAAAPFLLLKSLGSCFFLL